MRHLFQKLLRGRQTYADVRSAAHAMCSAFAPYQATTAHTPLDEIRSQVASNKQFLGVANEFAYYLEILRYLKSHRRCVVRPLKALYSPLPPDTFALSFRHDIDMDPFSAVTMSRALHAAGLSGTFYILHTASYYGHFLETQFVRNGNVIQMLRTLQDDHCCEVGLHTDGLSIYQSHGRDGAQAVRTELAWLRAQGFDIQGTAAHNSAPVYGAENFELFEGRAILNRYVVHRNDCTIPLQSLNEAALGLLYEANYPEVESTQWTQALQRFLSDVPPHALHNEQWMRTYLLDNPHCRWGHDYNLWLVGVDRWVISGHRNRDPLFIWDARLDDVLRFLDHVPVHKHIVCHIHPIYVGWVDK